MEDEHKYLKRHCEALETTANQSDPWVFLCASAYIEFLSKMVMTGNDKYSDFVKSYLTRINPLYTNFTYRNGKQDLPSQMWFVLRNGLIHSFTLKPNKENAGRENSILLTHNTTHLTLHDKIDGCQLNAYQFIKDLIAVTDLIFEDAKKDNELESRIKKYWIINPPLGAI